MDAEPPIDLTDPHLQFATVRPAVTEPTTNGHKPSKQATDDQDPIVALHLATLRQRLLTPQQLDDLPPPEPLIGDVIMRDTLAALYGRPGGGKSFVAMDWALSVATGTWWAGREIAAGPVIYIAAEGAAGLAQRKRAWETDRNVRADNYPIRWLPLAVNLLDRTWSEALTQLSAEMQPNLIIIDTVSRSMVGGDENASRDMGLLVEGTDRLRRASHATILLVHHTPKDGGTLRGHSSLEGAVDTSIEVKADGPYVILTCEKQKDAAKFNPIHLLLTVISEHGSCVLSAKTGAKPLDELAGSETSLLEAAWHSCGTTGLATSILLDVSGLNRRSFYRAKKSLEDRGLLVNIGTDKQPRWKPIGTPPLDLD